MYLAFFPDNCFGTSKRLYVQAIYASASDFNFITRSVITSSAETYAINPYVSIPQYGYITNLGTSFNKNFTYNIIDNTSFNPVYASVSLF
jgi:hypothetical protein